MEFLWAATPGIAEVTHLLESWNSGSFEFWSDLLQIAKFKNTSLGQLDFGD